MSRNTNRPHTGRGHFYLDDGTLEQLHAEAKRLDRSPSWLIRMAWKHYRETLRATPSHEEQMRRAAGGGR